MNSPSHRTGDFTCIVVAVLFMAGFVALAVKLHDVQVDNVASLMYDAVRQSVRRVRVPGERGRILASDASNFSIPCFPSISEEKHPLSLPRITPFSLCRIAPPLLILSFLELMSTEQFSPCQPQ